MLTKIRSSIYTSLLFIMLASAPAWAAIKEEALTATAQKLQQKLSGGGTLEYHFMLKAPPFSDEKKEQVITDLIKALKPIGE